MQVLDLHVEFLTASKADANICLFSRLEDSLELAADVLTARATVAFTGAFGVKLGGAFWNLYTFPVAGVGCRLADEWGEDEGESGDGIGELHFENFYSMNEGVSDVVESVVVHNLSTGEASLL